MKLILTSLFIVSFGSYANATETISVPWGLSEDCKNLNISENANVENTNYECLVEVSTKTKAFFEVMEKCHPKLGMVSKKTCLHVTSNLKVLIPLFNEIAKIANKPEYKLGLNDVIELEALLKDEEKLSKE
ncbi:MAG: hypothetical protein CML20_14450 [Rheinheimera sp.]|nr:hypothetical protein [Rheinheimera sp.]